jgi:hypothetical protein
MALQVGDVVNATDFYEADDKEEWNSSVVVSIFTDPQNNFEAQWPIQIQNSEGEKGLFNPIELTLVEGK